MFKIFEKLTSLLSKKKEKLEKPESSFNQVTYQNLNSEQISLLLEKYNCNEEDELVIELYEKKLRGELLLDDEKQFYDDPKWDYIRITGDFVYTYINEQNRALSESNNRNNSNE